MSSPKADGSYGLGEGKGTGLKKAVEQFAKGGEHLRSRGGRISEQEVIVERIVKRLDGRAVVGDNARIDASGFLQIYDEITEKWSQARPMGSQSESSSGLEERAVVLPPLAGGALRAPSPRVGSSPAELLTGFLSITALRTSKPARLAPNGVLER
jgi:hypothetical protein